MKKLIYLPFTLCILSLANNAMAQSTAKEKKETIIVEDNKNEGNTTIEIKNGEVFVDGKKVTDGVSDNNKNIKIIKKKTIINGKEVENEEIIEPFQMPFDGRMDAQTDRPMLGVSTKETPTNDGALVENVVPNSPASKLGLLAGDVITKVNDKLINNPKDLVDAISGFKAGDNVDVTFERNSKMMTKNVTLSGRNDSMTMQGTVPFGDDFFKQFEMMMPGLSERFGSENPFMSANPNSNTSPKIGVSVEDRADGEGVQVNDVSENSSASKAGIKKDDVITHFDTVEISSVDELLQAISKSQNKKSVNVELKRNGQRINTALTIPKTLKKREL